VILFREDDGELVEDGEEFGEAYSQDALEEIDEQVFDGEGEEEESRELHQN
jgi:hypothetical protein